MPEKTPSFRDFGILPNDLPPPAETIRCFFSTGRIVGQYIGTGLASALGLGLAVLIALTMPLPLSLLGCARRWPGLGPSCIWRRTTTIAGLSWRATPFGPSTFTRDARLNAPSMKLRAWARLSTRIRRAETVVMENLLGRVRGVVIRFHDRAPFIMIIELAFHAEIVNFAGQPCTNIHEGRKGKPTIRKLLKLSLSCPSPCVVTTSLYWPQNTPPSHPKNSLRSLNGPGTNRHVTLTDFRRAATSSRPSPVRKFPR